MNKIKTMNKVAILLLIVIVAIEILLLIGAFNQIKDWQALGWKSLFNENIISAGATFVAIIPAIGINMYRCYTQLKNEYGIENPSFIFIIVNWFVQFMMVQICYAIILIPILIVAKKKTTKKI